MAQPIVPILDVMADATYRELVGRCLEESELEPCLFASWRDAIVATTEAPTLRLAERMSKDLGVREVTCPGVVDRSLQAERDV